MKNKTEEIEMLSMVDQNQAFPKHFHSDYCISLITKGIECIEIDKQRIYSEKNHISITNPNEIHSNPLISNYQKLSFHTIYITQELMNDYSNERNIFFGKRSFKDVVLNQFFLELVKFSNYNSNQLNHAVFKKFINRLITHSTPEDKDIAYKFNFNWHKALKFINSNLKQKITLEILATHCKMEKFKFAKAFKYFCGISPMNYVLMQRVFSAKESVSKETHLTNLAYEYDFTDIAHFSKQFKRFIGLSPKNYQNNLDT